LGRAVLFKTLTIHSNLENFDRYAQGEHEIAAALGAGSQSWEIMRPIPNLPQDIFFTTDEMSLMLSLKDDSLFNELATLYQVHNSTIAIFRSYAMERPALTSMLPARMIGTLGVTEMTPEQRARVGPKMVEVNSIAESLVLRCNQDAKESGQILDRVVELLNSKLKIGLALEPKTISSADTS
jgi:hypothetical protein